MNKALVHIFDRSACLTRRQIREYVENNMTNEECHAVEMHLNSCPLCSDAVDGVHRQKGSGSIAAMESLDMGFLKERFAVSHPEVHLNSLAPAQTVTYVAPKRRRGKLKARPFRHTSAVALLLVLVIGILWYKENKSGVNHAVATTVAEEPAQGIIANESPTPPQLEESQADRKADEVQAMPDNSQRPPTLVTTAGSKEEIRTPNEEEKMTTINAVYTPNNTQPAIIKTNAKAAPVAAVTSVSKTESKPEKEQENTDIKTKSNTSKSGNIKSSKPEVDVAGSDKEQRQATLQTAKSYLNTGNKSEAIKLLEQLADQRGREKREAKRMLRSIKRETSKEGQD